MVDKVSLPERLTVLPESQAPEIVSELPLERYAERAGTVTVGALGETVLRSQTKAVVPDVFPAGSVWDKE